MDRSYVGQIATCTSCGLDKKIFSEEMKNDKIISRFCRDCDDILHRRVTCKHCGKEMPNRDYDKHLSDYHSE